MVLRSALVLCARLFPRPIRTRGDARRGEAGLMHTHSCHDALTLARHATATRASRYPAGCTLIMRQIAAMHATRWETSLSEDLGLWAHSAACCMVPLDVWRACTPLRLRGRLHMSYAGAFRCPRLHHWLSRTNDQ